MMLNRFYRLFALLFVLGLLVTYFCSNVYCQSTPSSIEGTNYLDARISVVEVQAEIKEKTDELKDMVDIKEDLEEALGKVESNSRMNAIQAVAARFGKSKVSAVMALVKQIKETKTGIDLVYALEALSAQIDVFVTNDIDHDIYKRQRTGYDAVWDNYIEAYGKLKGIELQNANNNALGYNDQQNRVEQLQQKKWSLPDPDLITVKACNGDCNAFFKDAEEHHEKCGGCNKGYYECNKKDREKHQVRYCGQQVSFYKPDTPKSFWSYRARHKLGICGAVYRNCDNPKNKQVHRYVAIIAKNSDGYNSYKGFYLQKYEGRSPTKCGDGTTTKPAVSIYGSNGVGLPESVMDKSSSCDSCICGSRTCPDARANHPKELPGAVSFSLSHGAAPGSIALSWHKPDFDGFSEITDYEYRLRYKGSDGIYYLLKDWKSFGFVSYTNSNSYYIVLQTGLSKARIQVTIRAVNEDKGAGTSLSYKYINTK